MDVKFNFEIRTPFTMIKVMTRIQVVLGKGLQRVLALLKSIGRLDCLNFTSQDASDECVTAMMTIPLYYTLVKSLTKFTLQINPTKHTQRRGLIMMPVNIIYVITEATIMSSTLHNQSMDLLQAN